MQQTSLFCKTGLITREGEFQTEVSIPVPYSLEVCSLKGVGHHCLVKVFGTPLSKGMTDQMLP